MFKNRVLGVFFAGALSGVAFVVACADSDLPVEAGSTGKADSLADAGAGPAPQGCSRWKVRAMPVIWDTRPPFIEGAVAIERMTDEITVEAGWEPFGTLPRQEVGLVASTQVFTVLLRTCAQ